MKNNTKLEEKIISIVKQAIDPVYEVVDVEYVKEYKENYLRVYLDSEEGFNIDDCEKCSRIISEELDKVDPIKESYYLEVSSPGIDRVLKKEKDFIRESGKQVDVKLYDKSIYEKEFVGVLKGLDENKNIQIEVGEKLLSIPEDKIAKINLHIEI